MLLLFSHTFVPDSFAITWTVAGQYSLYFTLSQNLLKGMFIELVMPSNHLNLYHPLLLQSSIIPSIMVFSNKLAICTRWPKYWSFSFSVSASDGYSGFISFSIDWFDLLQSNGPLRVFSSITVEAINFSALSFPYDSSFTSVHDYWISDRCLWLWGPF